MHDLWRGLGGNKWMESWKEEIYRKEEEK